MTMRLFLDANVLFSAAYQDRNTLEILFTLERAGFCTLITSAFALEEARRNIVAKKPDRKDALERLVDQVILTREPSPRHIADALAHGLPVKDAPILAAAVFAKATVLVTGDRAHFGHLFGVEIDGVTTLTVAATLDKWLESRIDDATP